MYRLRDYNPVNIRRKYYRAIYMNKTTGKHVSHDIWEYSYGAAVREAQKLIERADRKNWQLHKVCQIDNKL